MLVDVRDREPPLEHLQPEDQGHQRRLALGFNHQRLLRALIAGVSTYNLAHVLVLYLDLGLALGQHVTVHFSWYDTKYFA